MAAGKSKSRRQPNRRPRRRSRKPAWADWPTDELLDVRLCDLDLRIEGTPLEARIDQVLDELDQRGLTFRPHFWVSDDWFTAQGIPGTAVPFYLLHPRLVRLERNQMLQVEGASQAECLKILRHEVGHAMDHAYRLNLRRERQRLFGKSSKRYPEAYKPEPSSRRFVQHLDYWYAQAHPDEDFAETFAVWLRPRSNWRKVYDGWPVLKKLEYMDELMAEVAGAKPTVASRATVDPLRRARKTLRQHYHEKQQRYTDQYPDFFDADLRRLFSDAPEHRHKESAAAFLRRVGPEVRRMVSRWTGHYQYSLDLVLKQIVGRCRVLKLRLPGSGAKAKTDAAIMLTVSTMNFLYSGRRWLNL